MNLLFTGLRGTGKTTLAKMFAEKNGLNWFDFDDEIEKQSGMKIADIVEKTGWKYFRDLEHLICKKFSRGYDNCVFSTGGGTLTFARNQKLLCDKSIVVWLKADLPKMVRAIVGDVNRPMLTDIGELTKEIKQMMFERYSVYESIADIVYDVQDIFKPQYDLKKLTSLLQRLCVPIIPKTTEEAQKKMKLAYDKGALFTELRLDLCGKIDLAKLDLSRTIITPREQKFSTNVKTAFVDLELHEVNKKIVHDIKSTGAKLIVSYHNFTNTPLKKDLNTIVTKSFAKGADIVKIATHIQRYSDTLRLFHIARKYGKRCIVTGMGSKSEPARIFSRYYGSLLTFAAYSKDECSAPGQLTIDEHLSHTIITPQTDRYGIIGDKVSHSLSPKIHNMLFARHNIHALYMRFDCDDLKKDFNDLCIMGVKGFSITAPYKTDIIPLLDGIDSVAKKIGAVNTVVVRDNKKIGYNTDWIGVYETLKPYKLAGKNAVVLGYGGASQAVLYALEKLRIKNIVILRREKTKLPHLCDVFTNFSKYDYDIVINATPIDDPIDLKKLRSNKIAFDLRYTASKFLDVAKKKRCEIINGLLMLTHQGFEQFRLWTGIKPDIKDSEILNFKF